MLIVRPIQDKRIQEELCKKAGVRYHSEAMAYFAAESEDLGTTLKTLLGVLQFDIGKESAVLYSAAKMPDTDDDEAMIIMGRAAMSFMHRTCGAKKLISCGETDERLLKMFGFIRKDGTYSVDLEEFFKSPCKYNEKNGETL